jgi:hypothetical protein
MLSDIVTNIYNNLVNFITGQNAQDRFVNLLDSSPNILSDKDQADGYVGLDGNGNMFSSYYNENITRADLITALGANLAVGFKWYQVNDAVGSTKIILVQADSNISLYPIGTDLDTGENGVYDLGADTFTPISGGNASITQITVAALQTLQSTSALSTTTIYVVTDASPYVLKMQFKVNNQNTATATILDAVYGGTVLYTVSTNTWANGTIYDGDGNVFQGLSTGNVLVSSVSNIFNVASSNDLTSSSQNVFFAGADANILVSSGNNSFGINCSSNTLTNTTYNTFEATCQAITLDTALYNTFKSGVTNLNSINIDFNYCIVAGGDYSVIDFTNAAQLFGRGVIWSINKVLGTDLLEVTFDANLSTAQTGTYDTSTDTFTPYSALEDTYTVQCACAILAAVADSTSYFVGVIPASTLGTGDAARSFKFPYAGTLKIASLILTQTVNGSNETVNFSLRNVTAASDAAIGTFTSDFGASSTLKTLFTGLSITVNTTDDYSAKFATPAWGTNPTNWGIAIIFSITR